MGEFCCCPDFGGKQVCLVWEDLFGPQVPQTSAVCHWMQPLKLEAKQECSILWRLKWEQTQRHPIPEIFAYLLEVSDA